MHVRWIRGLLIAGLGFAAVSGCARQQEGATAEVASEASSMDRAQAATAAAPPASDAGAQAGVDSAAETVPGSAQVSSSATTHEDTQRKFIRTARAEFQVKDVYESALAIENVVAAHDGFVVRNDITTQVGEVRRRPKGDGKLLELAEYTVHGTLTVRVPSERTQAFLRAILPQMEFLHGRTFEARDAQFELMRQQLAWQRNQEAQQEIGAAVDDGGKLGHKSEAISARNQVKSARDEALIAQKEFEDRVAFSTIELSLRQQPRIRQAEQIDTDAVFAQNGPSFFSRLGSALRVGWYGVLDVLLALLQLWPLWLVVGTALWGWRGRRKA